jgi:hypothetical protein
MGMLAVIAHRDSPFSESFGRLIEQRQEAVRDARMRPAPCWPSAELPNNNAPLKRPEEFLPAFCFPEKGRRGIEVRLNRL